MYEEDSVILTVGKEAPDFEATAVSGGNLRILNCLTIEESL